MSNEYGFFSSKDGDRKYGAADLCSYFSDIFTDGILGKDTSELRVYPNDKMVLNVNVGTAYIKGRFFRPQTVKTIALSVSDDTYARYDCIVVRLDYAKRMVYLTKIDGIPSAEPAAPEIERNENYYDLCLAKIYVKAAATEITAADIIDTRFNTELCGVVTGVVDTINTTDLFAQYQAAWDLLMQSFSGDEKAIIDAYDNLNRIRPLEIGGTNLLLNSDFRNVTVSGELKGWKRHNVTVIAADGILKVEPEKTDDANGIYSAFTSITDNPAKTYTLTAFLKADAAKKLRITIHGKNNLSTVSEAENVYVNLTTEWQKVTIHMTVTKTDTNTVDAAFYSGKFNDATAFYIKKPKLEIGTEATDWSPSPYDVPLSVQKGTVTTGSDGTATVTFPKAFNYTPNVQVTPRDEGKEVGTTASILSVSTTSFKVKANKTTNEVAAVAVDWLAVEV